MTFTPGLSVTTFTAPGTATVLTFTLRVTDTGGLSDTDTVVVTVENQAPAANAGVDQSVHINDEVTLDGSGSTDPDAGDSLSYGWEQSGGPAVTFTPGLSVTTFTAPGTATVLTFTLRVTDTDGLADRDTILIFVNDGPLNRPPVADAGPDKYVEINSSVTINGAASVDFDMNDSLTFHWIQTGGPAVTFTPGLSVTTFTAPPVPAVLAFTLTVTDSGGLFDTDTLIITVGDGPVNQSPVANAGPDQQVSEQQVVILDGSFSSDPEFGELTFYWTQTGGPAVSFTSGLSVTTFTAPVSPSVLTFMLSVTDPSGLSTTDTVIITVENQTPIAYAGPDQIVNTNQIVTLNGSRSIDPDGIPLIYAWTQIGGPAISFTPGLSVTSFTAPASSAVLTFALTITDVGGLSSTDTTMITVLDEESIYTPTADAGPDLAPFVNTVVTLDGSYSTDPDGNSLTYAWTQTGGPAVSFTSGLSVTTFTAPAFTAALSFTLIVTDMDGLTDTDTVLVTANNRSPLAYAGSGRSVYTDRIVTLNGSKSLDSDGSLLTYHWTQTGGPAVTFTSGLSVTTFTAPASDSTLNFTLTVTDTGGLTDTDTVVITVIEQWPNQPPSAYTGPDLMVSMGSQVSLNGSLSFDPDSEAPLSYYWSQSFEWMQDGGSFGTFSPGPVISFTHSASITTFTAPAFASILEFVLVVTDSEGLTGTDTIFVTVFDNPPTAHAGADQSIGVNRLVSLDGSQSSDPDAVDQLSFGWSQSGGSPVSFTPGLSVTHLCRPFCGRHFKPSL